MSSANTSTITRTTIFLVRLDLSLDIVGSYVVFETQYATENWESPCVRDCNLDRRFCLGQHCFHDPVAQERQADSLYFEQSRDQLSDSNCLAARDLSHGKELSESVFR